MKDLYAVFPFCPILNSSLLIVKPSLLRFPEIYRVVVQDDTKEEIAVVDKHAVQAFVIKSFLVMLLGTLQ